MFPVQELLGRRHAQLARQVRRTADLPLFATQSIAYIVPLKNTNLILRHPILAIPAFRFRRVNSCILKNNILRKGLSTPPITNS